MFLAASLMLAASAIEPAGLSFQSFRNAPTISMAMGEEEKFPDITYGKILFYEGKKYMCGTSSAGNDGHNRYVIALELDWQIWEPIFGSETWAEWDHTYKKICEKKR